MCLDKRMTKSEKAKYDKPVEGKDYYVGWKEFNSYFGKLYPDVMDDCDKSLPREKWLKEEDYRNGGYEKAKIIAGEGIRYPMGFHVYMEEPPWSVKVRFRNPVVWGWQDGLPIAVAKEIYIPRRRWRKA